ncbi:MAG: hypothetical protein LBE62_14900 [Azonexus sp.]|nr:hypothetical protein [Azonexus sp.]
MLTEIHPWKSAWFHINDGECVARDEKILLNTARWYAFFDSVDYWRKSSGRPFDLFEITDTGIHNIGAAPDPERRIFPDAREYRFGDNVVRMASEFKMECVTPAGERRWQINLKSYLYTAIAEKNGVIYFGTAGNGGRCWGVSLADGRILFSVNTGGTENYAWWNDRLICAERKGCLLVLDRNNGNALATLSAGKLHCYDNSPLRVVGDWLYTVAFDKTTKYAVAIALPQQTLG